MEHEIQKLVTYAPRLSSMLMEKTASTTKDYAKQVLNEAPTHCAATIYLATRTLFGVQVTAWEPETIWLSLEREYAIDLDEEARNKLQAAISLIVNPAFFWDSYIFQRTAAALVGDAFDPESLLEIHPAEQCWAVYEASVIRGFDLDVPASPEFDEDVQSYTAVCLKRDGFVIPPDQLMFAKDALASQYPKDVESFATKVKNSWAQVKKEDLQKRVFQEDPLGVQLAQLAGCKVFVDEQAEILAKGLRPFTISSSS